MSVLEVVENPRRKRRRKMTAKQLRYFGPRRARRRNPALATYYSSANPQRRRARVRGTRDIRIGRSRYLAVPLRRRRSRRNPGFLGLGNIAGAFDLNSLLMMGAGMAGVKVVPGLVSKVWPAIPRTGLGGKAVQVGAAFALRMLAGQFLSKKAANDIFNGAVALTLYEVLNETILPAVGLSGLGEYRYLTRSELAPALSGGGRLGEYDFFVDAAGSPAIIGG